MHKYFVLKSVIGELEIIRNKNEQSICKCDWEELAKSYTATELDMMLLTLKERKANVYQKQNQLIMALAAVFGLMGVLVAVLLTGVNLVDDVEKMAIFSDLYVGLGFVMFLYCIIIIIVFMKSMSENRNLYRYILIANNLKYIINKIELSDK